MNTSANWRAGTRGPVPIEPGQIELAPDARDQLAQDLASLGKVDAAWPEAALSFVLHGAGAELLDAFAMRREAGEAYVLQATRGELVGGYTYPRAAWLRSVRAADARLFLRLGLLWAAIRAPWKPYFSSPQLPAWIPALIDESPDHDYDPGYDANAPALDALLFEGILVAAGESADLLTREYIEAAYGSVGEHLPGLAQALVRHRQYVDRAFETQNAKVLRRLCAAGSDGSAWLEPIASAAVSGRKGQRDLARDLVLRGRDAYVPALSQILRAGDVDKRAGAAEMLGLVAGERALAALKASLTGEKTARVRSAIDAACRTLEHAERSDAAPALELPPLYDPQPTAALPAEARALFERTCDEWHERALAEHPETAAIAADHRERCWTRVCSLPPWSDEQLSLTERNQPSHLFAECLAARSLFEHPSLTPTHIVRFADQMHGYHSGNFADRHLRAHRERIGVAYDLRTVALAYARSGKPADYVEDCHSSRYQPAFRWEPAAVWPLFAERLPFLDAALGLIEGERHEVWACQVLAMFPAVPQRYYAQLWSFALDKQEPLRTLARRCLGTSPALVSRVIAVLSDSSRETRGFAASWLGELGDPSAIEPLRECLRGESHELTKARCIEALEKLGVAAATLIDREQLVADAKRMLAKGVPEALSWLPLRALPKLSWQDGSALPTVLVESWIVQAFKQKQSASNGAWKAFARELEPAAREQLASWLLSAWITQDTQSDSDKAERAQAVKAKGLLALVGGFGGSAVEAPIATYLNTHYGNRKQQCLCLLDVLAWLELPVATQRLMRTARSFRTPSIRRHAAALIRALAQRKGWTQLQLADRTVPDLGLDERGTRELADPSASSRRFKLTLDSALTLRLEDDQGKPLRSLPQSAKQLAKPLQALRKELKVTLTLQTQRLFDAMCEQRAWPAEDWLECIHRQPVMRALGERLVWTTGGEQLRTSFRILGDGSLTDLDDEPVSVEARELVRLAHAEVLDAASGDAWLRHFADYKLEPLFRQFGRPRFAADEKQLDQSTLEVVAGTVTNGLELSRCATKLGWERGPLGDGPSFDSYLRNFVGPGIVAQLSTSSCDPFALDQPVTLGGLSFFAREGVASERRLLLREVPSVLRSECTNDVREMSALEALPPTRRRSR